MRHTLTLLILLLTFGTNSAQETFEGVITYSVDVSFKGESVEYRDYFAQKYGDTVKVFYNKKGDIYKKIIGSGKMGYDFNLYKQNENNYYAKWKNLDTLYYYNVSEQNLEVISTENGESNDSVDSETSVLIIKARDPKGGQYVTQTFYYNGEPYINPELYEKFKDFFTYDYYKKAKSPYMKLELDLGSHVVTYTAINIQRTEVGSKIFEVPKEIPKKKY